MSRFGRSFVGRMGWKFLSAPIFDFDAPDTAVTYERTLSDAFTLTDAIFSHDVYTRALADSLTLTDSLSLS